jgi:outer membrane lipoprotein
MMSAALKHLRLITAAVLLLGLGACASGPRYDIGRADTGVTAAQVAAAPIAHSGARVVWGGVIITTRNQADHTEIEILSYPLDDDQRPDTSRSEQGRFLARYDRYLEGVDYAPGRHVTVSGTMERTLEGMVGAAPYTFPLILADDVYLWPRDGKAPGSTRFHFGIGVIFSR